MKKQLLVLALISASQTMPIIFNHHYYDDEGNYHTGPGLLARTFGAAEDVAVGAVETPGVVLAGDDYDLPYRDRRYNRRYYRNRRYNNRYDRDYNRYDRDYNYRHNRWDRD